MMICNIWDSREPFTIIYFQLSIRIDPILLTTKEMKRPLSTSLFFFYLCRPSVCSVPKQKHFAKYSTTTKHNTNKLFDVWPNQPKIHGKNNSKTELHILAGGKRKAHILFHFKSAVSYPEFPHFPFVPKRSGKKNAQRSASDQNENSYVHDTCVDGQNHGVDCRYDTVANLRFEWRVSELWTHGLTHRLNCVINKLWMGLHQHIHATTKCQPRISAVNNFWTFLINSHTMADDSRWVRVTFPCFSAYLMNIKLFTLAGSNGRSPGH